MKSILLVSNAKNNNSRLAKMLRVAKAIELRDEYNCLIQINTEEDPITDWSDFDEVWTIQESNANHYYAMNKQRQLESYRGKVVLIFDDTSVEPNLGLWLRADEIAYLHENLDLMLSNISCKSSDLVNKITFWLPYQILEYADNSLMPQDEDISSYDCHCIYVGYLKLDRVRRIEELFNTVMNNTKTVGGCLLNARKHSNDTSTVCSDRLGTCLKSSFSSLYLTSPGQYGQITTRLLESLKHGVPVVLDSKSGLTINCFPKVDTAKDLVQAIALLKQESRFNNAILQVEAIMPLLQSISQRWRSSL
mgnify:CR=1 FL=1